MTRPERVIGGALAALLALATTAAAQNAAVWQAHNDGQGFISAQACAPNSTRCVRLQCLAFEGGGVHWYVDAPEPSYSPESTNVTWEIDGQRFTLRMTKAGPAENRMQSYETAFDASNHGLLVERLKAGNRLTVASDQFSPSTVSLRGSGAALTQTLSACPLTDAGFEPAAATPIDQPFDAVMAMMAAQSCMATESEIFDAITNAGFGIWDANQFIALGAENGTLLPLDHANGEHRYRLTNCTTNENALAVDPNATELNLVSDQIPQPVSKRIAEIAAACGPDFQTAEGRDQNAFLAEDINADGTYDFLLEHALFCPTQRKALCDPSGCPYSLFVSGNSGWQTFEFVASGYKGFTTEGLLLTCGAEADKAGVFVEDGKLIRRDCL